jgi:hypothetical protein
VNDINLKSHKRSVSQKRNGEDLYQQFFKQERLTQKHNKVKVQQLQKSQLVNQVRQNRQIKGRYFDDF